MLQDIAAYIKKEFDKKYNPTWHCIVGRNFGSYVTHETKHFIYFYLGQVAILLFKSGWAMDQTILKTFLLEYEQFSHQTCQIIIFQPQIHAALIVLFFAQPRMSYEHSQRFRLRTRQCLNVLLLFTSKVLKMTSCVKLFFKLTFLRSETKNGWVTHWLRLIMGLILISPTKCTYFCK